jgi:hypothetical protein
MWGRQFQGQSDELGYFQYKEFYTCMITDGHLTFTGRASNEYGDEHK